MPRELVSSKTVSWKGWLVLLHKKLQTSSFEGIGWSAVSRKSPTASFIVCSVSSIRLYKRKQLECLLHPPASSGTHQIDLIDVPSYPELGQGFASQDPSKRYAKEELVSKQTVSGGRGGYVLLQLYLSLSIFLSFLSNASLANLGLFTPQAEFRHPPDCTCIIDVPSYPRAWPRLCLSEDPSKGKNCCVRLGVLFWGDRVWMI
nr:hypothetical protein Iba_chr11aCG15180 [Ipomoea batatas]